MENIPQNLDNNQNPNQKKTGLGTVYLLIGLISIVYFFIFLKSPSGPFNLVLLFFGLLMILKSIVSRRDVSKNISKPAKILLNVGLGITGLMSVLFFLLFVLAMFAIFSLFGFL